MKKHIHKAWENRLSTAFEKPYFKEIEKYIAEQKALGKTIFPKEEHIFEAFNVCAFEDVKVVILGQDPYHGKNQAHGLSFSVAKGEKVPPSLKNIYKELNADLGYSIPTHGNLMSWANQGVFLLNAILTVNESEASSHRKVGWEHFTDYVIQQLSEEKEHLVFILWGNFARKKIHLINTEKHCVLESVHPSPFSARYGFFGSKVFSKTNAYLQQNGIAPIDWEILD